MATAPSSVAVDVIHNTIKPQGLEPFNFQLSLAHSPATYWSIKVGNKIAENAAWCFLNPTDAWQALKNL